MNVFYPASIQAARPRKTVLIAAILAERVEARESTFGNVVEWHDGHGFVYTARFRGPNNQEFVSCGRVAEHVRADALRRLRLI